jgi:hypothetical protein
MVCVMTIELKSKRLQTTLAPGTWAVNGHPMSIQPTTGVDRRLRAPYAGDRWRSLGKAQRVLCPVLYAIDGVDGALRHGIDVEKIGSTTRWS